MPTSSSNQPPKPVPLAEIIAPESEGTSSRSARMLVLLILIPTLAVVGLLVWGFAQVEFSPYGVIVNNDLGVIPIEPRPATDFTITTFDGDLLTLSDLRGKVVMVDFWASWCPPCRREARDLAQVYEQYRDAPVEFIGIDVWDVEADALAYIERYGIGYPNGPDADGTITVDYGVGGIPEKLFITREGILVKKIIGPMDQRSLTEVIDEMLDAPLLESAATQ